MSPVYHRRTKHSTYGGGMHVVSNRGELRLSITTSEGNFDITVNNHFQLIRALLQRFDYTYLVSPFLFMEFNALFSGIDLSKKRVDLVTCCTPRGNDLLTKPFSMQSFGRLVQEQTGRWPVIHIDQSLHSKVYIFGDKENPVVGVVTSGNLTHGGLQNNSETGIVITDKAILRDLRLAVDRNIDFVHITEQQVSILCSVVGAAAPTRTKDDDIDMGLPDILAKNCAPSTHNTDIVLKPDARYFVKVSGYKDEPILPENREPRDDPHPELSFAREPKGIYPGDMLVEVAVGGKCFLTYYTCSSGASMRTAREQAQNSHHKRWKYYMTANNLAPMFGATWFEDPIFYGDVTEHFKKCYPGVPITTNGGDNLQDAINFGNSYFQITKDFALFVKDLIDTRIRNLLQVNQDSDGTVAQGSSMARRNPVD